MKEGNILAVSMLVLGVLFLFNNFGFITGDVWDIFWRAFWPILLIGFSINMLLKGSKEKSEKPSSKSKKR